MNIPEGLKHVLEVYRLVNKSNCSYADAVRRLTANSRITAATIRAACTTNLGINTKEFEMFLDPQNAKDLMLCLSRKYPPHQKDIAKFIDGVISIQNADAEEEVNALDTLFEDEKSHLYNNLLLKSVMGDFEKWVIREDIPQDVRVRIREWLSAVKASM